MPNIDDDIRKAGKRLKALRKTASAHNKANRIFVYKRDGRDVSEDSLKSQMRSKGLSTESYPPAKPDPSPSTSAAPSSRGPVHEWP